jgi:hypothetical protein
MYMTIVMHKIYYLVNYHLCLKSFEQLFNYFVAGIFCEGVLVSILKKRTSGHKKDLKIQKVIRNLKSKKDRQYNDNKAKGQTTIYKTYIQN